MQLKTYIEKHDLTYAEFAKDIGVSSEAVRRYVAGERIPQPEIMQSILARTKRQVMPNDFYPE